MTHPRWNPALNPNWSHSALPDQDHYTFMCAVEAHHLTGSEAEFALRYPQLSIPIMRRYDEEDYRGPEYQHGFLNEIRELHEQFRLDAPVQERLHVSTEGFRTAGRLQSDIECHAKCHALDAAYDLSNRRAEQFIERDWPAPPRPKDRYKKAVRRLNSTKFIKRAALGNKWVDIPLEIMVTMVADFVTDCSEAGISLNYALDNYGSTVQIKNRMIDQVQIASTDMQEHRLFMAGENPDYQKRMRQREREAKKKAKKSLKALSKAQTFLERVAGKPTADAYFEGDRITIKGNRFNFVFQMNSKTSNGHSSMNTILEDKGGVLLSHLCVYFKDTPAPEQLVCMMTHIQAGEEDKIIKTGNAFNVTEAGRANPIFTELKNLQSRPLGYGADILEADRPAEEFYEALDNTAQQTVERWLWPFVKARIKSELKRRQLPPINIGNHLTHRDTELIA